MAGTISGKTVTQRWQRALPGLAMQGNGLYRILGPLVIGVTFDLLRDKKRYSPYFVFTPLTDFQEMKFNAFTTLVQAQTPDNRQLLLPVEPADDIDAATVAAVLSQWQLPLQGAVPAADLCHVLDRFADYVTVKVKPAYRITLAVLKLQVAIYLGDTAQVEQGWAMLRAELARVPPASLTAWFGGYEAWLQQLEVYAANRLAYQEEITALRAVPPFSKLSFSEIYR